MKIGAMPMNAIADRNNERRTPIPRQNITGFS
jgi:hypothetical protein